MLQRFLKIFWNKTVKQNNEELLNPSLDYKPIGIHKIMLFYIAFIHSTMTKYLLSARDYLVPGYTA